MARYRRQEPRMERRSRRARERRRRIASLSLFVLSVSLLSVGAILAWMRLDIELSNRLTAHQTSVTIEEVFENGETSGVQEKKVRFENTGSSSVFLRVSFTEYWMYTDSETQEGLLLSNFVTDNDDLVAVALKYLNWDGWTDGDDGWYYFNYILTNAFPGNATGYVLETVTFPTSYTGIYEAYEFADYYLYFKAEVVQASDGASTLNSDEVNRAVTESLFGKIAEVAFDGTVTWLNPSEEQQGGSQ